VSIKIFAPEPAIQPYERTYDTCGVRIIDGMEGRSLLNTNKYTPAKIEIKP
jgi:hypothetical protein